MAKLHPLQPKCHRRTKILCSWISKKHQFAARASPAIPPSLQSHQQTGHGGAGARLQSFSYSTSPGNCQHKLQCLVKPEKFGIGNRLASRMGNMLLHWRGAFEACFLCGNSFPLAGVAHGKPGFPYGKPVFALAWSTGSMLPVRELIPVGRCRGREGFLPVRKPFFCTGVGYGEHASRTRTHSRWQV